MAKEPVFKVNQTVVINNLLLANYQALLHKAIRKARIHTRMRAFYTYSKRLDQMVRAF
jgi:hypothetical protein